MSSLDRKSRGGSRMVFGLMWGKVAVALQMVAITGVLSTAGVLLDAVDGRCADPQPMDMKTLATLQPGEVNANHASDIIINNTRYSVLPSATVMDDEGNQRDLKEVVPGTFVRFHVRKDQIDTIVVILPK